MEEIMTQAAKKVIVRKNRFSNSNKPESKRRRPNVLAISDNAPNMSRPSGKESQPWYNLEIELKTEQMIWGYNTIYKRYRSTYFYCSSSLTKLDKIDTFVLISSYLKDVLTASIDAVIKEREELIALSNSSIPEPNYPKAGRDVAQIPSPEMRLFIELLQEVDKLIMVIDGLFLIGNISKVEQQRQQRNWKEFLSKTYGRFQSVVNKIGLTERKLTENANELLRQASIAVKENAKTIAVLTPSKKDRENAEKVLAGSAETSTKKTTKAKALKKVTAKSTEDVSADEFLDD